VIPCIAHVATIPGPLSAPAPPRLWDLRAVCRLTLAVPGNLNLLLTTRSRDSRRATKCTYHLRAPRFVTIRIRAPLPLDQRRHFSLDTPRYPSHMHVQQRPIQQDLQSSNVDVDLVWFWGARSKITLAETTTYFPQNKSSHRALQVHYPEFSHPSHLGLRTPSFDALMAGHPQVVRHCIRPLFLSWSARKTSTHNIPPRCLEEYMSPLRP
jgi:hypothetical protein